LDLGTGKKLKAEGEKRKQIRGISFLVRSNGGKLFETRKVQRGLLITAS